MKWEQLILAIDRARERCPHPKVVVVHFGGKDLAAMGRRHLLQDMRWDLMEVAQMLRPTEIIWSELIPRFKWREANVHFAVEGSRRKMNFLMKKACNSMGWGFIRHSLINLKMLGYYEQDGVLLAGVGLDMFMSNISGSLELAGCT